MITTTTTTRGRRGRRGAAAALVGLGLVSLGVASASHLNVTAQGDLVASGVDIDVEGFLPDTATASVAVTYDLDEAGATLATEETLAPTVTLTIDSKAATIPANSKLQAYFYATGTGDDEAAATVAVASATDVGFDSCASEADIYTCDITEDILDLETGTLPHYDRVAVVAVSGDYDS